jgi:hypothetical protein
VVNEREIAHWLTFAMHALALVDGGEVIQHAVRLRGLFLQVAQQRAGLATLDPHGGDAV